MNLESSEDNILPVGILCVWASGELDLGMCAVKVDIEPSKKGVYV
jgi:hypothetical protein